MTQLITHQQSSQSFLPLQLATKYYTRWDCDIQVKSTPNGYFKCLEGKGEVEFTNGNVYKGSFSNGLMHGDGEFVWACGLKYKGPFVGNNITGVGVYEWADGSWYKGELLNGKRHNKGEYYCHKDKSKYTGEWKHGIRHGHGLLQFNQQTSYQGDFYQGLRHGKGKMRYSSGNTYQGQWKNDKKSGYGVMNWFTQNQKYQGEWLNDLQHGLGTYYWFDGKIEYKIIKNIYKGHWVNGQRHGFGSFFYSNGCRYEGYFERNQKNGEGLVMDENGNVKLEYFEKDKLMYTIPESHVAMLSMNNRAGNTQQNSNGNTNDVTKQPEKLPKITSKTSQMSRGLSIHQNQPSARGSKISSIPKSSFKQNSQTTQIQPTHRNNHQFPSTNIVTQKQAKLKIEQNVYTKCLDVPISHDQSHSLVKNHSHQFIICKEIMNLLLRENSHLRQWYKHCSLTVSNNTNPNTKDFYTGVTIENLFKLIKDLRIIDQFVTIPKINREFFYQGWKSNFDISLPNEQKLKMVKEYLQKEKLNSQQKQKKTEPVWDELFNNETVNYANIEWYDYAKRLDEQLPEYLVESNEEIDLNLFNDIQNPKKIILYRHFVSYLLRIAYLQTLKNHVSKPSTQQIFQKSFRQTLQKLFKTINNIFETAQRQAKGIQSADCLTFVSKEKAALNLSTEYSKPNEELFAEITKNYKNLHNFADNTVTVKVLYQLLEKFGLLKEPAEKILFLEKIERFIEPGNTKHTLLRKELKAHFGSLQKVIYTSPYFLRFMNYTMIQKEFQELLYLALNRKINSNCKQESVKKYKQAIDQIINYVKKESSSSNPEESLKSTLKPKKPVTLKDKQKIQLIQEDLERKAADRQAERKRQEQKREEVQRELMARNDFRWEEEEMDESDEYFD